MLWPVHGVDDQNVLPAVVVVVEEARAVAHGFRQIFFPEGPGVVFEVNPSLFGYVGKLNRARQGEQEVRRADIGIASDPVTAAGVVVQALPH